LRNATASATEQQRRQTRGATHCRLERSHRCRLGWHSRLVSCGELAHPVYFAASGILSLIAFLATEFVVGGESCVADSGCALSRQFRGVIGDRNRDRRFGVGEAASAVDVCGHEPVSSISAQRRPAQIVFACSYYRLEWPISREKFGRDRDRMRRLPTSWAWRAFGVAAPGLKSRGLKGATKRANLLAFARANVAPCAEYGPVRCSHFRDCL
jgi:hypothetical protein